MSKFIIVQNLKTLRRGPNRGLEDEVVFLHKLLNYHLGPPSDQLPMVGSDASAFGPRTEAKVKKFQEVNKIDIGTKFFKDGVVGQHTWKVLTEPFLLTGIVLKAPQLTLNPPKFPPNLQIPKPPQPVLIPVPKLQLPITVQSGATFTFGGDTSVANSLQITARILKRKDGVVREVQGGAVIVDTPSGRTDKTDLGILATISTGDLPGSGEFFSWSIQQQDQLLKSITDRVVSGQSFNLVEVDLEVFKRKDVVKIKVTGQGGGIFEVDYSPGRDNNQTWAGKVGLGAFFGITAIFGDHEDEPKK